MYSQCLSEVAHSKESLCPIQIHQNAEGVSNLAVENCWGPGNIIKGVGGVSEPHQLGGGLTCKPLEHCTALTQVSIYLGNFCPHTFGDAECICTDGRKEYFGNLRGTF